MLYEYGILGSNMMISCIDFLLVDIFFWFSYNDLDC